MAKAFPSQVISHQDTAITYFTVGGADRQTNVGGNDYSQSRSQFNAEATGNKQTDSSYTPAATLRQHIHCSRAHTSGSLYPDKKGRPSLSGCKAEAAAPGTEEACETRCSFPPVTCPEPLPPQPPLETSRLSWSKAGPSLSHFTGSPKSATPAPFKILPGLPTTSSSQLSSLTSSFPVCAR